tara:strand:+ start:84 stop:2732 length:2649 start_codon:yes stop_codon:yes gene_type:complete
MGASRGDIKAGRAYVELYVKNSAFYRGLRNAQNRLRKFGADMQSIGRNLMVISAAMLLPLGMAVKTFASFDDEMRKVGARSRGTADELLRLRNIAKDLGATTSFTAGQVAALQATLAQKGFDRGNIAAMTGDVLNLARAAGEGGEGDTTAAAHLVAGNLRAFNLEAEQATYLADLFSAAVNNSNFTMEGLTNALSSAAPIANRYGLSVKDTVNVLAQMTNVNIDAASAGTAMRNLFLKLSDEAGRSKFNKAIKEATGNTIEFINASGDLKPMPQLLFEIGNAVGGLGSAAQGQILSDLFGLRAVVAGGVLGEAGNQFRDLDTILSDVEGTAAMTAEEMDAGLGGMFRMIMSGVEGVKIALAEGLEGELAQIGAVAQQLLGGIRKLVEDNKEAVVTFAKWGIAIGIAGSALMAIGLTSAFVSVAIGGLLAVVSMTATAFSLLLIPLGLVKAVFTLLAAVITTTKAILLSMTAVVAVVRTAIISFVVSLRLLQIAMLTIRATTIATTAIVSALRAGMILLRAAMLGTTAALGLMRAGFIAVATSSTIATIATQAFAAVGFVISALTSPIALVAVAIAGLGFIAFRAVGGFEGLAEIARSAFGSLSRNASVMYERIAAFFGQLKDTFLTAFGGIRDAIASGELALAGQIAIAALQLAFFQGLDAIGVDWSFFSGGLVETMRNAGAEIYKLWDSTIQSISDLILKAASNNDTFNYIFEKISGIDVQYEMNRAAASGNQSNLPEALKPGGKNDREKKEEEKREESEEVKKQRAKLDRLVELARKKREAANLKAEGDKEFGDDGYIPGGGGPPAKGPVGGASAVTFSAAALVALGGEQTGVWTSKDTAALKRIMTEQTRDRNKAAAEANKELADSIAVAIGDLAMHHP